MKLSHYCCISQATRGSWPLADSVHAASRIIRLTRKSIHRKLNVCVHTRVKNPLSCACHTQKLISAAELRYNVIYHHNFHQKHIQSYIYVTPFCWCYKFCNFCSIFSYNNAQIVMFLYILHIVNFTHIKNSCIACCAVIFKLINLAENCAAAVNLSLNSFM